MQDGPPERVSLRAIAEQAGVSRMTVSRALRRDPAVPSDTGRRVREIAQRLGYRPDPTLTRLMTALRERRRAGAPPVLAYLTAHEERAGWRWHPSQRRCFEGAARRATELGYKLEEFWAGEPGMTDARLSQIIWARGIEGVIVAPLPAPGRTFPDFNWALFSGVEIGYSLAQPALHRVCSHHVQGILLLTEKLRAAGYRRIGLAVSHNCDERVHHHWRAGYLAAQSLGGGNADLLCVTPDWNRAAFARWLQLRQPDALITIGPQVGAWLEALGFHVPRDLALAHLDVALGGPDATGIDQNVGLIGSAAVDLVGSLLHHQERGVPAVPRVTMIEGTFVPGRTARPMTEPVFVGT
jgi:LacI family transcriptional regulator